MKIINYAILKIIYAALTIGIVIVGTGLIGCRGQSQSQGKRYDLKGKVVSVDKRGRQVIITHETIPDFMEAMTMPFSLKDEWALDKLAPDDTVQATLVVDGDRSWLEDLVFSRTTPDPSGATDAEGKAGPVAGDEVPDFPLVNQNGKTISFHQYRGRALILTFIYTRCPLPDYCPLMTQRFIEIDKALMQDPVIYEKTRLLSISVDPEFDTPKVLRRYGAAATGKGKEEKFEHWEFAAGSAEQVKNVAQYFGLQYWPEGDQIIHALRTAIIAPDGKLLKLYTGNEWKPSEILSDLRGLNLGG